MDGERENHVPGKIKNKIISIPEFRRPIRETRCLIPADYFILEHKGNAALFFLNERPFAIAGIYDSWKKDIKDKELYIGASILIIPAEGIFKDIGFTRQPFVIEKGFWRSWLNDVSLTEVTGMIRYYPDKFINGYKIDLLPVSKRINEKSITKPASPFFRENKKPTLEDKMRSKFRKGVTDIQDELGESI